LKLFRRYCEGNGNGNRITGEETGKRKKKNTAREGK